MPPPTIPIASKKVPEVIDLLSSSPEPKPETARRIVTKAPVIAARSGVGEKRDGKVGSGYGGVDGVLGVDASRLGENARVENSSHGNASGDIDGALKPSRSSGNARVGNSVVKEKEKGKEITETEKIRELRLKRFGGLSQGTAPAASDLSSESRTEPVGGDRLSKIQAVVDAVRVSLQDGERMERKGKEAQSGMFVERPGKGKDGVMLDHAYWGGIDLIHDDDDFGGFDSIQNESKESTVARDMGVSYGREGTKYQTAHFGDPFRSSSPEEVPKVSKAQPRKSAARSKNRIEVQYGVEARTGDTGTRRADWNDPFRSSSPIPENPKVQSQKSATTSTTTFEEFSIMNDKFGTPVDFDESYDLDVPVAKRQRVSPTSRNPSSTGNTAPRVMTKETGGYRRTASAVAQSSHSFKPKALGLKRSKTMDLDPITFTSSPDPFDYKIKKAEKGKGYGGDDEFDHLPKRGTYSVSAGASRPKSRGKDLDIIDLDDDLPGDSDSSLPDILNIPTFKTTHKPTTIKSTTKSRDTNISSIPSPSRPRPKPKSTQSALAAYEKEKLAEKRAIDKAAVAVSKVAAKEAEKSKKKAERENKAIEREREAAIAKVNTSRTDKKISRREMIVDFPQGMDRRLTEHTKVLLGSLEMNAGEWDCPAPLKDVVRWRRKVDGEWNEDEGCWTPVKPFIQKEEHALVVIKGEEFVKLAGAEEGKGLACHVLRMKGTFENGSGEGSKNIIYLIEGLTSFLKKYRNAKNRKFTQEVRNRLEEMDQDEDEDETTNHAPAASKAKKKSKAKKSETNSQEIDEEIIEDAQLNLQLVHGVLVHHTSTLAETAQWIAAFTQHIATAPYRRAQDSLDQNFCMKSGQVKCGTSVEDTFIKMLQETNRLTAPVANSVVGEYGSVTKLVEGFERAEKREKRVREERVREGLGDREAVRERDRADCLLMRLRKESRADGAVSDRAVGPMLSKRLYKVFLGREPGSMDI